MGHSMLENPRIIILLDFYNISFTLHYASAGRSQKPVPNGTVTQGLL